MKKINIYSMNEGKISETVLEKLIENKNNVKIDTLVDGKLFSFKSGCIRFKVLANIRYATYCGEPMAGPFREIEIRLKQGLFGKWITYQNISKSFDESYLNNEYMDKIFNFIFENFDLEKRCHSNDELRSFYEESKKYSSKYAG